MKFLFLTFLIFSLFISSYSQTYVANFPNTTISVSTASNTAINIQNLPNTNGIGTQAISVSINQATLPTYSNTTKIVLYGAVPVIVVISFIDVQKIDGVEQVFNTDFYMRLFWPDSSVCSSSDLSTCLFDPNNMWNPQVEFPNLRGSVTTTISNPYSIVSAPTAYLNDITGGSTILSNWGNTWVVSDQRYSGTFSTTLYLQNFPYDKQDVQIFIESALYDESTVRLIFPNGLEPRLLPSGFNIPEWNIRNDATSLNITSNYYAIFQASFSRASVYIHLARQPDYYINKICVGVIFLILMNMCIFGLEVDESDRMMGTISIFLALVAYLFVLSGDVPKVAYSTRIDSFMNVSFYFVFFSMAAHCIFYILNEIYGDNDEEKEEKEREAKKLAEDSSQEPKGIWESISWQRKLDIIYVGLSTPTYFLTCGLILFSAAKDQTT